MDRRVARTRAAIEDAFEDLLAEKGYSGVTITEVLERANIGKSTFYAHYTCKEDLLAAMMDKISNHAMSPTGPESGHDYTGQDNFEIQLAHFLTHLQAHLDKTRVLLATNMAGEFEAGLKSAVYSFLEDIGSQEPDLNEFLTGALMEKIRSWAKSGLEDSPEAIAHDYAAIARRLM